MKTKRTQQTAALVTASGTIAATLLLACATVSHAAEWPQWLGPAGNGVTEAGDAKLAFGDDGVDTLWRKKIGLGFASMAVADGRVYAMGAKNGSETLYCFDAESGKEHWTFSYPGKLVNSMHEGGPSSTPAVAGGRVYIVGKEGQVHCLDAAKGGVVWKANLKTLTGERTPKWGFSSSAVVDGDRVYIQSGATVALDATSGDKVWISKKRKPSYATPAIFERSGKTLIATLSSDGLAIVDAGGGNEIAFHRWETQYDTNATTPLIMGDRIFVSTGYNKGCTMLGFDGKSLSPMYRSKSMSNHMNNSVPHGDQLYGFDGNSHQRQRVELRCIDAATGKVRWSQAGLGCGSLILAGDTLVILSDQGELVTAKATPDGFKPLGRAQVLGGKCWTHPVLADGRLFARNARGDLVAIDMGG